MLISPLTVSIMNLSDKADWSSQVGHYESDRSTRQVRGFCKPGGKETIILQALNEPYRAKGRTNIQIKVASTLSFNEMLFYSGNFFIRDYLVFCGGI